MSRFHFKKDIKYDLALLSEVESLNPFSVAKNKASKIWDQIATALLESNLHLNVTGRRCRERTELLLKEFRAQEQLSVKASGVEEEDMDSLKFLLTSVVALEDERPAVTKVEDSKAANKLIAEGIRKRALTELATDSFFVDLGQGDNDVDLGEIDEANLTADAEPTTKSNATQNFMEGDATPPKKTKTNPVLKYLEIKAKNESELKKEELRVRAMEAVNKRMELEILKSKQEVENESSKTMRELLVKLLGQNQ